MSEYVEGLSKQEPISAADPSIVCTVEVPNVPWREKGKNPVATVKIDAKEPIGISVVPSMDLTALPKKDGVEDDEYWAVFSIEAGAGAHDWQKLDVSAEMTTALSGSINGSTRGISRTINLLNFLLVFA